MKFCDIKKLKNIKHINSVFNYDIKELIQDIHNYLEIHFNLDFEPIFEMDGIIVKKDNLAEFFKTNNTVYYMDLYMQCKSNPALKLKILENCYALLNGKEYASFREYPGHTFRDLILFNFFDLSVELNKISHRDGKHNLVILPYSSQDKDLLHTFLERKVDGLNIQKMLWEISNERLLKKEKQILNNRKKYLLESNQQEKAKMIAKKIETLNAENLEIEFFSAKNIGVVPEQRI